MHPRNFSSEKIVRTSVRTSTHSCTPGWNFAFQVLAISAVNRIATWTFSDKKQQHNNNADSFGRLNFDVYIDVDNRGRAKMECLILFSAYFILFSLRRLCIPLAFEWSYVFWFKNRECHCFWYNNMCHYWYNSNLFGAMATEYTDSVYLRCDCGTGGPSVIWESLYGKNRVWNLDEINEVKAIKVVNKV